MEDLEQRMEHVGRLGRRHAPTHAVERFDRDRLLLDPALELPDHGLPDAQEAAHAGQAAFEAAGITADVIEPLSLMLREDAHERAGDHQDPRQDGRAVLEARVARGDDHPEGAHESRGAADQRAEPEREQRDRNEEGIEFHPAEPGIVRKEIEIETDEEAQDEREFQPRSDAGAPEPDFFPRGPDRPAAGHVARVLVPRPPAHLGPQRRIELILRDIERFPLRFPAVLDVELLRRRGRRLLRARRNDVGPQAGEKLKGRRRIGLPGRDLGSQSGKDLGTGVVARLHLLPCGPQLVDTGQKPVLRLRTAPAHPPP